MTVKRDRTGHEYVFNGVGWVMVGCSCLLTAHTCPRPRTLRRGELKDAKYHRVRDKDVAGIEERLAETEAMEEYWRSKQSLF